MNSGHFHIPMEEIMAIQVKLSDKPEVEALAKQFVYDESKSTNQNLKTLTRMLVDFFGISGKTAQTLSNYLVEKNIPIQVNFKPLKIQQLVNILEQWLSMHTENSTILEKLYTNKHRNIHFRRILFDQQQTINDYFQTLSDKKMLKAVNLYQLLVQILSSYYLYQYRTDSQSFFEKVNSFNKFVDIVNKFIHSQKRISLAANKEDFEYIQRIEFERLIQFWQEQNNELQLLTERRINKTEMSVQTKLINVLEAEVQTQNNSSLAEFINTALFTLNKLTPVTNNAKELAAIERLYSSLRNQKFYILAQVEKHSTILSVNSKPQHKKIQQKISNRQTVQVNYSSMTSDHNQTVEKAALKQTLINKLKFSDQIEFTRTVSPSRKVNNAIETIYNYYLEISGFSIVILEKCLRDIGVIEGYNTHLLSSLLQKKLIASKEHISESQFKKIFKYLMQNDKQLTIQVLQDFITYRKTLGVKVSPTKIQSCVAPLTPSNYNSFFVDIQARNYLGRYINDRSYL